ncbi:MAG TPA: hypothetical protein VMB18_18035 [Terriglobales bacterium]|nr:hypothetical protein [Terriglobales bacterium]
MGSPVTTSLPRRDTLGELRGLLRERVVHLFALGTFLALVGWHAFKEKYSVLDLDIWWHLKVGQWIVEHRGFPHTGILSRTAADRPWAAYSWGYELLLSRAYDWFGLVGAGVFGVVLTMAVAYAVYWMARRLSGSFWVGCVLGAITCSAFLFNLMPRPVFFSMILYAVTLTLLLEAQRTGRIQLLYWLPLAFLLWANLHIQFIYGLFVVGLFVAANLAHHLAERLGFEPDFLQPTSLPAQPLIAVFMVCLLATCCGPYTYNLYFVIAGYVTAKFPYTFIREFQAISFRAGSHFVELILTGAAFFALGLEKKLHLFKLALLIAAAIVGYRTMRDTWFICLAAAACIADSLAAEAPESGESLVEKAGIAAALAIALALLAANTNFTMRGLDEAVSSEFPVNAINFLRHNPQPGPLYNTFDWGGFLTWYMPDYPVAIDGRTDLYGDEIDTRFFKTQQGDASYVEDPYLNESHVILLSTKVPLASVLLQDSRFRLIYQDSISVVFARD